MHLTRGVYVAGEINGEDVDASFVSARKDLLEKMAKLGSNSFATGF